MAIQRQTWCHINLPIFSNMHNCHCIFASCNYAPQVSMMCKLILKFQHWAEESLTFLIVKFLSPKFILGAYWSSRFLQYSNVPYILLDC